MTLVSFQHAGRSDKGARERQEDAFGIKVFEHSLVGAAQRIGADGKEAHGMELVAVLADGMGGHVGGATASQMVTSCFLSHYPEISGSCDKRLLLSLDACNKRVAASVEEQPELQGMGCTLLGVAIDRHGVYWVSVGDSLLYLYHQGKLQKLNEDHSLAPVFDELVANGEMSRNEALHHPKRHMLRSALTGKEIKLVDLNREVLPLDKGDWLILASDGLGTIDREETGEVIARNADGTADQLAQALVEAVKRKSRPGQDNVTVLAIGFDVKKTDP